MTLTEDGRALIGRIVGPWQDWFDEALHRLDEAERIELYRLLVKGPRLWDGVWPASFEPGWA